MPIIYEPRGEAKEYSDLAVNLYLDIVKRFWLSLEAYAAQR
jgi:hypothetical protein